MSLKLVLSSIQEARSRISVIWWISNLNLEVLRPTKNLLVPKIFSENLPVSQNFAIVRVYWLWIWKFYKIHSPGIAIFEFQSLFQIYFSITYISVSSSDPQFCASQIFCSSPFWVFFPDKSLKKNTPKNAKTTLYIDKKNHFARP